MTITFVLTSLFAKFKILVVTDNYLKKNALNPILIFFQRQLHRKIYGTGPQHFQNYISLQIKFQRTFLWNVKFY